MNCNSLCDLELCNLFKINLVLLILWVLTVCDKKSQGQHWWMASWDLCTNYAAIGNVAWLNKQPQSKQHEDSFAWRWLSAGEKERGDRWRCVWHVDPISVTSVYLLRVNRKRQKRKQRRRCSCRWWRRWRRRSRRNCSCCKGYE